MPRSTFISRIDFLILRNTRSLPILTYTLTSLLKKVYLNLEHVDTVPATRLNRPFVQYHKILHYCRQHYYQEAISSSENYCMCVPHAGTLQKKMKLVQVYCTGTGTRVQEYSSDLRAVSIGIRILQYQNVSVGFVARTCMVETARLTKLERKDWSERLILQNESSGILDRLRRASTDVSDPWRNVNYR